MARIADKHGLTNKYRPYGSKRVVKRGRPRTRLLPRGTKSKKRRTYHPSPTVNYNTMAPITSKGVCMGCLTFVILLLIGILLCVVLFNSSEKESSETTTLEQLQSLSHPKVGDNEKDIKKYYKGLDGVSFEHLSHFKSEKAAALTWHYTSVYGDDTLNHIVIDFSKIPVDEQAQLTFETVLDIAISFVPVEEILEYYALDRAIYVEREDHIAHELYYKEIDEKEANRPSKYYQDHGFSIVIKEYSDGHFKVSIETSWYDSAYDTNPTVGKPASEEELASHQTWDFSLEAYTQKVN